MQRGLKVFTGYLSNKVDITMHLYSNVSIYLQSIQKVQLSLSLNYIIPGIKKK